MTPTFNPEKYKELLARHLPKVIRTEAENENQYHQKLILTPYY